MTNNFNKTRRDTFDLTTVTHRVCWPSGHASSPNAFSVPNVHVLLEYYAFFCLQGSPGTL
uniref:Uncharacterized protein n=1 Tax=Echinococcus granulosus TaxID=6210 RepID=A0A068WQZ8_ECHGR|nr:hypothetical protein EgrG_000225600 [Echinococcus granulosus]